MVKLKVNGKVYKVDQELFLVNPDEWDEGWTGMVAFCSGVNLTLEHWVIIEFLRSYYDRYEIVPFLETVLDGLSLSKEELLKKIPGGLKMACRLAGLSKPPPRRCAS